MGDEEEKSWGGILSMKFHHKVISGLGYPAKAYRSIRRVINGGGLGRLRVISVHDISPDEEQSFSKQLKSLLRYWKFITPKQFDSMISGNLPIKGNNLLLTFDDGFKSNLKVAQKILVPLGIHALFFVVPEFVEQTERYAARRFLAKNIFPVPDSRELPSHWINMSWDDLKLLIGMGHTIGAHTMTHSRLSQLTDQGVLEREIIDSADFISQRLDMTIDHFAYPFGDIKSVSHVALKIAQRRFRYIFSGLRGENHAVATSPHAIRRDAFQPSDPFPLVMAYLEGTTDFYYANSRRKLDRWVNC